MGELQRSQRILARAMGASLPIRWRHPPEPVDSIVRLLSSVIANTTAGGVTNWSRLVRRDAAATVR